MKQTQVPQRLQQAGGNPTGGQAFSYEFLLSLLELDAQLLSLAGPEQPVALTFPGVGEVPPSMVALSPPKDDESRPE